jgi:hypothetical protein
MLRWCGPYYADNSCQQAGGAAVSDITGVPRRLPRCGPAVLQVVQVGPRMLLRNSICPMLMMLQGLTCGWPTSAATPTHAVTLTACTPTSLSFGSFQ